MEEKSNRTGPSSKLINEIFLFVYIGQFQIIDLLDVTNYCRTGPIAPGPNTADTSKTSFLYDMS